MADGGDDRFLVFDKGASVGAKVVGEEKSGRVDVESRAVGTEFFDWETFDDFHDGYNVKWLGFEDTKVGCGFFKTDTPFRVLVEGFRGAYVGGQVGEGLKTLGRSAVFVD